MGTEIATGMESALKYMRASRAPTTQRKYAGAQASFIAFAGPSLPADPVDVACYLAALGDRSLPATLRLHASAIAALHSDAGLPSPTKHPAVVKILSGHARTLKHAPKQPTGLTYEHLAVISDVAGTPRRQETEAAAIQRGLIDVAMISTMRDALLRRGEAVNLLWRDFRLAADGTGRLTIRHSKTDQEGRGFIAFLSEPVAESLMVIRHINPHRSGDDDSIFGLCGSTISRRIAAAAGAAGLVGKFTGHSPRVGMAMDLMQAGMSLIELQHAGRWKSPEMPAYYTRSIRAGENAVAKWHALMERESIH